MADVTAQQREEARRLLNGRLDFGDTSRILATVIAERDEARWQRDTIRRTLLDDLAERTRERDEARAAAAEGRAYYDEVCARSVRERDVLYDNHVKELTDLRERAAAFCDHLAETLDSRAGDFSRGARLRQAAREIRVLPFRRDDDAR